MAYLPGVPDMGPKPVASGTKASAGGPQGIAKVASGVGKPGRVQHLGNITSMSPGSTPRASVGGGDPALHAMGHYGKNAPPGLGSMEGAAVADPTAHPGASMIRGGSGGMRSHVRKGGLGPGRASSAGNSSDYSMNSSDTE